MNRNIILTIIFALALASCASFRSLVLSPLPGKAMLRDDCHVDIVRNLQHYIDTAGRVALNYHGRIPGEILPDSCGFSAGELFMQTRDSAVWFLTIRPEHPGRDEVLYGNLYTLYPPRDDSVITFVRRIKKYSQASEFERGKYMGFTYFLENDTTVIIKIGSGRY